jgi:xanthine dehydrogenase accessory factor
MFDNFFAKAYELMQKGIPFATATVVRAEKPTSGKPGDRAIITADGTMYGWIGGSCAQPTVIKEALKVLKEDECRLIRLSTDMEGQPARPGLLDLPMTCFSGGTMEIYIESQQPRPRLLIVGTLPVAQALAQLGKAMNYHVLAMDLDGEKLSDAHEYVPSLATVGEFVTPSTFVVVATHGNYDEAALEHLLKLEVAYIGLVSSRHRATSVRDYLHAQGFSDEALGVLKAPAGLDIHARRGDEIALSIMAEIVQKRRSHEGIEIEVRDRDREDGDAESGKQKAETATGGQTLGGHNVPVVSMPDAGRKTQDAETAGEHDGHSHVSSAAASASREGIAIDPICQMEVEIATAKYQSEYEGLDYYFCCEGCKRTFDTNPTAYVTIHHAEPESTQTGIAIDPICEMEVEIATAKYHSQYEGLNYYFCCAGCKRTFEGNPPAYVLSHSLKG